MNRPRLPLILLCSIVLGLTGCRITPGAGSAELRDTAADLEEIVKLHESDMAAVKEGDVETLIGLWAEDGIAIPPGQAPVVGIENIARGLRESQAQLADTEVVDYVLAFAEVTIVEDHAYEWGTFHGTYKSKDDGTLLTMKGRLMRVLRKDPGKGWRVARSMWTVDS